MNSPQQVGNIIKDYRLKRKLTQKQLAELLFVEETTVSRWECGLGYPNTSLFDQISGVLGVPLTVLLGDDTYNVQRKKRNIFIIQALITFFCLVLLTLVIVKNDFSSDKMFRIVISILASASLVGLLVLLGLDIFKKKTIFKILMVILSYTSMVFFVLLTFESKTTVLSYLSLLIASLNSCVCSTLLLLSVLSQKQVRIYIFSKWLIVALNIIPGLFVFYSLQGISLVVFPPLLYFVYYIFGVLFASVGTLFFYNLFRKRVLFLIFVLQAILMNALFFISLFVNDTGYLTDILVYIGILNFPLTLQIFIGRRLTAYP